VKFVIFALILSVGIVPVIPFSDAVEQNQICIDKVGIEKTSSGKITCVTQSTAESAHAEKSDVAVLPEWLLDATIDAEEAVKGILEKRNY
jgi:hypothetical protein